MQGLRIRGVKFRFKGSEGRGVKFRFKGSEGRGVKFSTVEVLCYRIQVWT